MDHSSCQANVRYRVCAPDHNWHVDVEFKPVLLAAYLDGLDADSQLLLGMRPENLSGDDAVLKRLVTVFGVMAIRLIAGDGGAQFELTTDVDEADNWTKDTLEQLGLEPASTLRIIGASIRLPRDSDVSLWQLKVPGGVTA